MKKRRGSASSNHQILKFNPLIINGCNFLLTVILDNSGLIHKLSKVTIKIHYCPKCFLILYEKYQ